MALVAGVFTVVVLVVEAAEPDAGVCVVVVVLTPVGRALLAEILPLYHAAAEVVWSEFPAERAAQLVADLECVSANAARVAAAPPGGMTVKG